MTPKVFRFGKFRRWGILLFGFASIGVLVWLTILYSRLSNSNEMRLDFLFIFPFGMTILVIALY
jgi:hypothetical protein